MTHVVVTADAETDIADINAWYETSQPMSVAGLDRALDALEKRLATFPRLYPAVHGEVRRAPLARLPYLVWYTFSVESDTVTVLAVCHVRQDRTALFARF